MQRKWWIVPAALLALLVLACGCDMRKSINQPTGGNAGGNGNIVVNEFLASNKSFGQDENGSYGDWIELYNRSDHAIDIGGYYVTDNLAKPTKYHIPTVAPSKTTIASKGFLLIWCDSDSTGAKGPLHTNFSLSAGGEQIGLYDTDGSMIEELTFDPQTVDISYGRKVDGGDTWVFLNPPTPGTSNGGGGVHVGPVISNVVLNPTTPAAGAPVTVSAQVTDAVSVVGVTLYYKIGSGTFTTVNMTASGTTWSGAIPGQATGTTVSYYLRAIDTGNVVITDPATAPTATLSYTIGGGGGPATGLFINEFVASNTSGITDSLGAYPDWVEIYNAGSSPVDIGGMYTSDSLAAPMKYPAIPTGYASTVVPAHGYLVFYPDGNAGWGPLHMPYGLKKAGEQIGLFTAAGAVIDTVTFGAQTSNLSQARVPDGGSWHFLVTPTPGATNGTAPR